MMTSDSCYQNLIRNHILLLLGPPSTYEDSQGTVSTRLIKIFSSDDKVLYVLQFEMNFKTKLSQPKLIQNSFCQEFICQEFITLFQ